MHCQEKPRTSNPVKERFDVGRITPPRENSNDFRALHWENRFWSVPMLNVFKTANHLKLLKMLQDNIQAYRDCCKELQSIQSKMIEKVLQRETTNV